MLALEFLRISFAALILLFPSVEIAYAAQIERSDNPKCAIQFTGKVEQGDAERLRILAETLGLTEPADSGEPSKRIEDALCLNSRGGSYSEGIRIASMLRQYGIPTRLLKEADCYSSCAFIFMAGRLSGEEYDTTKRTMDVRSHLGFHAPYVTLGDDVTMRGREITELLSLSSKRTADFIQFGSGSSPFSFKSFFPVSLVVEMLSSGPNEVAMVDTVQDVARWEIELDGHLVSKRLDDHGRMRACINFQNWALDQESQIDDLSWVDFPLSRTKLKTHSEIRDFAIADTGGMALRQCQVEVTNGPSEYIQICSRDEFNGLIHGDCEEGWGFLVPWYYGLNPDFPITLLAE